MFEYITQEMFSEDNRLSIAVIIKNIIKKVYGVSANLLPCFFNQFLLVATQLHQL